MSPLERLLAGAPEAPTAAAAPCAPAAATAPSSFPRCDWLSTRGVQRIDSYMLFRPSVAHCHAVARSKQR